MDLTPETLDELERLLGEATPGPVAMRGGGYRPYSLWRKVDAEYWNKHDRAPRGDKPPRPEALGREIARFWSQEPCNATSGKPNAQLFELLWNHAPALLRAARENAVLREACSGLLDTIHDSMTHELQRHHSEAIGVARKLIRGAP